MTEAELQLGAYTGSSVTALEPAGVGGCIADFDAQPGEYRIRVDGEFDTSFNLKIQPVP